MYSTEHKNVVISISTADKRRNHIIEQFGQKQIPFEFFDAFTPSEQLDIHLLTYLPNIQITSKLTAGEKGCLMSHFMLWKKCVEDNLDYISIFEDDILLGEIFVLRLETFLMPVQLEHQQQILPFQERNMDILKSKHFGTAGYIISNGAARYLINLFENLAVDKVKAIDEIMFNEQVNVGIYQIYQLNPAICVQELQLNQEESLLVSDLEQERKNRPKIKKNKTLKQRLVRIKENIIRALNKDKWKEQQRLKEMQGKEIVHFK